MVDLTYIPSRGDIAWLDLDPTLGREQQKRRPVLILSPAKYHIKTSLALIVPITSQIKGYRFEVPMPKDCIIQGVILSNAIRTIDWRIRNIDYITTVPDNIITQVKARYKTILP
jgi:mRNA interferase MazF